MLKGSFRIYPKFYERSVVAEIDAWFIFGDNVLRKGSGPKSGQAVIRGLPNALGIVTKFEPTMDQKAFFNDWNPWCMEAVLGGFKQVTALLKRGEDVYYPLDGIGTGRALLPIRAPKLYQAIEWYVATLKEKYP